MAYIHEPLQELKSQLRLFSCWMIDGQLHGQLRVFDIASAPPYRCVSYVWGPPPATHPIHLAGGVLRIRTNLYEFFKEYTRVDTWRDNICLGDNAIASPWIFADQICIDQENVWERGHQVQLMASIYSNAFQVLAWLGAPANTAQAKMWARVYSNWSKTSWVGQGPLHIASLMSETALWRRLWVFQELNLARSILVMLGSEKLDDLGFRRLRRHDPSLLSYSRLATDGRIYIHAMESSSTGQMLTLVEQTSNLRCEDPRDRLFAIQSLFARNDRLVVDYSKSIDAVLIEFVNILVKGDYLTSDEVFRIIDWLQSFHAEHEPHAQSDQQRWSGHCLDAKQDALQPVWWNRTFVRRELADFPIGYDLQYRAVPLALFESVITSKVHNSEQHLYELIQLQLKTSAGLTEQYTIFSALMQYIYECFNSEWSDVIEGTSSILWHRLSDTWIAAEAEDWSDEQPWLEKFSAASFRRGTTPKAWASIMEDFIPLEFLQHAFGRRFRLLMAQEEWAKRVDTFAERRMLSRSWIFYDEAHLAEGKSVP